MSIEIIVLVCACAFLHWQVAFACAMDFIKSQGKLFEGNRLGLYFATLFTAFAGPVLLVLLCTWYVVFAPYFLTRWLLRSL